jgi:flagellar motor switch protein FliM
MAQILSQDEIDALLGGLNEVTETKEDEAVPLEHDEAQLFDFKKTTVSSHVKFPAIDVINDQFNRGLRITISSILRIAVDTVVIPSEVLTFKDFLRRLPVPSSLHILKMEPLRGHALLVIDSQLVFTIVEVFLGSARLGQARVEGREFTSIEQRLIKRIVNSLLIDIEKAWNNIYPIKIQYIRSEINPSFAKIVPDDDAVIVTKFQMEIDEISGGISVCIPLNMIQPIKQILQKSYLREECEDPVWKSQLLSNLKNTNVDIKVNLGKTEIKGFELLNLTIGDIIQLDINYDEPLILNIQGVPKFYTEPGIYRGQIAVKILDNYQTT